MRWRSLPYCSLAISIGPRNSCVICDRPSRNPSVPKISSKTTSEDHNNQRLLAGASVSAAMGSSRWRKDVSLDADAGCLEPGLCGGSLISRNLGRLVGSTTGGFGLSATGGWLGPSATGGRPDSSPTGEWVFPSLAATGYGPRRVRARASGGGATSSSNDA